MKLPSPSLPPPNIIRAAGVCLRTAREPIGGENAATELRNSTLSRLRDIGELVMGSWLSAVLPPAFIVRSVPRKLQQCTLDHMQVACLAGKGPA